MGSPERLNYYHFLHLLVKTFKPQVSIEIGVENGIASAYMCKAADEYGGLVIGIDFNALGRLVNETLPSGFSYVLINEYSQRALSRVDSILSRYGDKPVGLVYQDSSHHYQDSKDEWRLYSQFVRGLWICDDISPAFHDPAIDPPGKGMVQYFEELPGDKRLYPQLYPNGVNNVQGVVIVE